jgi:hypothetical protein
LEADCGVEKEGQEDMKLFCLDCYASAVEFPDPKLTPTGIDKTVTAKCPTCKKDWSLWQLL